MKKLLGILVLEMYSTLCCACLQKLRKIKQWKFKTPVFTT